MCNPACIAFGREQLGRGDVAGKDVLEVGALDVNGSLRRVVEPLGPTSYVGVDLWPGPGVDEVCAAERLLERFGPERFDVVLATEVIEHVEDWRSAVSAMKGVLRPGGVVLLTTRSPGFPFMATRSITGGSISRSPGRSSRTSRSRPSSPIRPCRASSSRRASRRTASRSTCRRSSRRASSRRGVARRPSRSRGR